MRMQKLQYFKDTMNIYSGRRLDRFDCLFLMFDPFPWSAICFRTARVTRCCLVVPKSHQRRQCQRDQLEEVVAEVMVGCYQKLLKLKVFQLKNKNLVLSRFLDPSPLDLFVLMAYFLHEPGIEVFFSYRRILRL